MKKKISELPALTSVTGNEEIYINNNGQDNKVTINTLLGDLKDIPTSITMLYNTLISHQTRIVQLEAKIK